MEFASACSQWGEMNDLDSKRCLQNCEYSILQDIVVLEGNDKKKKIRKKKKKAQLIIA